jgi:hypothetical protein
MKKIICIGVVPQGKRGATTFFKIEDERGYLSFTGVIGPTASGNARGGCGQIIMEFQHRYAADDDKYGAEHDYLIKPSDIKFAPGWNVFNWLDFLDLWEKWHMVNIDIVPKEVIDQINALPDTNLEPAWV